MVKRAAPLISTGASAVDERARALRARVEALARQPEHTTPGGLVDLEAHLSLGSEHPARPPAEGGTLPMLIRSSESSVYLKWCLMLQDQLARTKRSYHFLKEENAVLRRAVHAHGGNAEELLAAAIITGDGGGRSCSSTSCDSQSTAFAESGEHSPRFAGAYAHAAPSVPAVSATPLTSQVCQQPPSQVGQPCEEEEEEGMASDAAVLMALSSPKSSAKPSPRLDPLTRPLPGPLPMLSAHPSHDGLARAGDDAGGAGSAALRPPSASLMSGRPSKPSPLSQTQSPYSALASRVVSEQDELLADLLCSPTTLHSPRLPREGYGYSASSAMALAERTGGSVAGSDGAGSSCLSALNTPTPLGEAMAATSPSLSWKHSPHSLRSPSMRALSLPHGRGAGATEPYPSMLPAFRRTGTWQSPAGCT